MTVTGIIEYSKNKYKVFLNDAFAFVLYKGDLRHYGIEIGQELNDEDIDKIYSEVLLKRAKLRAMHLLEKRDYTVRSMKDKLKENLYPASVIDEAVDYVVGYHYIDDERYARAYINSHISSMSRRQIIDKLRLKGVSEDIIENCIDDYLEENGDVFDEQLNKLMARCLGDANPSELGYNDRQKLFAKLFRKGYSVEKIEKAFRYFSDDK